MGNFGDYQYRFYQAGVLNKTSSFPFTFSEWEHRARENMNPLIYGYVKGGAGDEHTQDANVAELRRYGFTPRMLRDRSDRDMSVTFLERRLPTPVFLCPVGVLGNIRPEGDLEAARVCAELDLVGMYSTLSSATLEEVADARGDSLGIFSSTRPLTRSSPKVSSGEPSRQGTTPSRSPWTTESWAGDRGICHMGSCR
ncbi:lactate 2-monooxygenase [Tsukamurella paurometabola DSM] [Mycobacterium shimoidei]|uniref:Lactate 2-monooxygenase [Tsukamurella paurometabola DSM] n=1 Tax=Mycobacterium shimoidei TaxID=29313 RepID=A0A375YWL9_MYCSH|nr:lactate 2-monooxygenase [Tsukamurella paurometabola DSM] [Mycobacterium shimoidei]